MKNTSNTTENNNNNNNNNNIDNNILSNDNNNDQNFDKEKKKKVLKLLKTIGIDTRFISYTKDVIYINDQRFSKFSKKRQETFKKYYPELDIISSSIFQKICIRASKVLSEELAPKDKILLLKPKNDIDNLLKIVLEPYSRKYGVEIVESNIKQSDINSYLHDGPNGKLSIDDNTNVNIIAKSLTLDEKVEDILSNIFSGNGIGSISKRKDKKFKFIYPFINISNAWIDSFNNKIQEISDNSENNKENEWNKNNKMNNTNNVNCINTNNETSEIIAESFMEFLDKIIPQYKENLLKSTIFIKSELNKKEKGNS